MDEKTLIANLKAGDRGAYELLVKLHFRSVYNIVFRYMQDHGGTDDVVQDTFLKAYHAIESFRGESSFKSWLVRIGINTAKNALRSRDSRPAVDLENVVIASEHKYFKNLEKNQTALLLKKAVDQLPDRQRQSLELRIYEDLSFKEIAEIMDCPFDTAKANFRHAVMNLKKILENIESGKNLAELKLAFEQLRADEDHEN